jgi:hypothetical protein
MQRRIIEGIRVWIEGIDGGRDTLKPMEIQNSEFHL